MKNAPWQGWHTLKPTRKTTQFPTPVKLANAIQAIPSFSFYTRREILHVVHIR